MSATDELPDIGAVLAPILARVPAAEQPLLVALAERMAAERYRGWAGATDDAVRRTGLLACAAREEEIARRIEALHPGAAAIQADILRRNPDLPELNRSLFAPHPLARQLVLQARGERLGARTWRAFAQHASEPVRETFLGCARLEEENAEFLESLAER